MNQYPPDDDLVLRVKQGHKEVFEELYHRYKKQIFAYIYRYIGGDITAAQDIVQETFLNAYKNIGTFRFGCKFFSWLYTIATNLAKNFILREKSKKNKESSIEGSLISNPDMTLSDTIEDLRLHPDGELEKRILQEDIQSAINSLPEHLKAALLLCDINGLSYQDASEVMGCNVKTVGSRLAEARKKFRRIFTVKRRERIR